jgi:hypothetical protein
MVVRRDSRLGRRWTPDEARQVLGDWRASGLSLAAYAERRGLAYERLRRWKGRLALSLATRRAATPLALRPVRVVSPPPRVSDDLAFEIRLPDGRAVGVAADFEAEGLRRLLAVLEA